MATPVPERRQLLRTRGVFAVSVQAPLRPLEDSFEWLMPIGDRHDPLSATWYIDGSLFDEKRRFGRRMRFGLAVVSVHGELIGCGRGLAPGWAQDAAGAELWAFHVVLKECAGMPYVVTDCKGIFDGLRLPQQRLLGEQSRLGRTWSLIVQALDGRLAVATARLTWMPAHTSASAMAFPPRDSSGQPISWVAWRANRLADALAKYAASRVRLPASVFKWIKDAEELHRHQAALLGWVTHAATHHEVHVTDAHGKTSSQVIRDSCGQRPQRPRTWRRFSPQQAMQQLAPTAASAASSIPPRPAPVGPREKARRLNACHDQRQRVADAARTARHLEATELQPSNGPSAAERLEALRERVRARAAEDAAWDAERRAACTLSQ